MLKAITRAARLVDEKVAAINAERAAQSPPLPNITIAYFFDHYAKPEDMSVIVAEEDFYAAQRELIPSVSAEELGHYERVRKEFEGVKDKDKNEQPPAAQTNGTAVSKEQIQGMLKMLQAGHNDAEGKSSRQSNGKGRIVDEEEDDFVVRTDHLSINGTSKGNGRGKGKGRVEIAEGPPQAFGDAAEEDENMYA